MSVDVKIESERVPASRARALWCEAPGRMAIRDEDIAAPGHGQALVRALFSGVSRGTERLVFTGRIPRSEHERMRCPLQGGIFPFPVKYGYCAVGIIEAGPDEWRGRRVFVLHPHQTAFLADLSILRPLPEGLAPRRAILSANMETALNALWDSGAGPGDRIVVVGAGAVGLLAARLAARLPGADTIVVDRDPSRAQIVAALGARFVAADDWASQGVDDADVVFHASASAAGLDLAIAAAGMEGAVVEMSWHGAGPTPVSLGGAFHSRRLRLISTQVGQVSPSRRPRWDYARRMAKAMELLRDDPALDALIDVEVAFDDMPARANEIFADGASGLGVAIRY